MWPPSRCIASAVSGRLVKRGRPLINTQVRRQVRCHKQVFEFTATSDLDGNFRFAPVYSRSPRYWLPLNFAASQHLCAQYNEQTVELFTTVKRDLSENSEFNGQHLNLEFDIRSPLRFIELDSHFIESRSNANSLISRRAHSAN